MADSSNTSRSETPDERADRNFAEVVQELRVAQTGVQVLFAFLLSLPFLTDFPTNDAVFVGVYTAALLCAAASALTFIAPVAFHRLHFRQGRKEGVVWLTHRTSLLGLFLLVSAMTLAIWLVMEFLWSAGVANLVSACTLTFVLLLWVLVPQLVLSRSQGRD